jgi:RND family efflux transporter MFP subunit
MNARPFAPRILVALCWLASIAGLGLAPAASAEVVVTTLSTQEVGSSFTLDGSMQAQHQTVVSAQASGRITALHVKAGDRVKLGQLLAVIDDRATQAGVAQAQAGVAQAQAQLENAKSQFERTQELVKKGFMGEAALDTARAQLRTAQAATAQASAARSGTTLAQGFTRVTAPQAGVVLATHAEVGDLAAPGVPLVTVFLPTAMRAVLHVPASLMSSVRAATGVQIKLNNGQWIKPVKQTLLPSADPVSQTVEMRLDLAASDTAAAMPGEQLQVRFTAGQSQRLVVPRQAVVRRGELTGVYVVQGQGQAQRFVLRAVRLGATVGDTDIEVLAGLRAGDQIALQPVAAAQHGSQTKE